MDQVVFWVSLTPDIGTLAWAPLNCSGGSPASRTTRAHSPALCRTRDYSDWEICHKSEHGIHRLGGPRGNMGRNRTCDLSICDRMLYHCATMPTMLNLAIPKSSFQRLYALVTLRQRHINFTCMTLVHVPLRFVDALRANQRRRADVLMWFRHASASQACSVAQTAKSMQSGVRL